MVAAANPWVAAAVNLKLPSVAVTAIACFSFSATLPGTAALGFYEKPEQRTTIASIQLAADVPESQRVKLDVMRTDTPTFTQLIESRRNRHDDWYKTPAGYIDVCSVPIPVRAAEPSERSPVAVAQSYVGVPQRHRGRQPVEQRKQLVRQFGVLRKNLR